MPVTASRYDHAVIPLIAKMCCTEFCAIVTSWHAGGNMTILRLAFCLIGASFVVAAGLIHYALSHPATVGIAEIDTVCCTHVQQQLFIWFTLLCTATPGAGGIVWASHLWEWHEVPGNPTVELP
jgi:hypothetical protein